MTMSRLLIFLHRQTAEQVAKVFAQHRLNFGETLLRESRPAEALHGGRSGSTENHNFAHDRHRPDRVARVIVRHLQHSRDQRHAKPLDTRHHAAIENLEALVRPHLLAHDEIATNYRLPPNQARCAAKVLIISRSSNSNSWACLQGRILQCGFDLGDNGKHLLAQAVRDMLRGRTIESRFAAEVIRYRAEVRLRPFGQHPSAGAIEAIDAENLDRGLNQPLTGGIAASAERFLWRSELGDRPWLSILIQSNDRINRSNEL